ncbi:MAG TPA: universal stress protein [Bryobacteraceae bacterium]|nr:universal stress protein [Bryobacteraceae bacterium]
MLELTKILVPIDFSERCLGATRYAEALAKHFSAEVVLFHALEPIRYELSSLEFGGAVMTDLLQNRTEQTRAQLNEFLAEELTSVPVRRVLQDGDPAEMIVGYAHQEKVGLIAMPTHGYGPFRRFILGSVTAKVLHDADCPVLTGVHMEEAPTLDSISFRTIVCAVDLGPQSRKAVCWAAHLAGAFSAKLVLTHAIPCIESKPGEYFDAELTGELAQGAHEELAKLRHGLEVDAQIAVERGDPPRRVCDVVTENKGDLLVIGRGSAGGVFGRLRTNAYAIIRQSPCPVVSV